MISSTSLFFRETNFFSLRLENLRLFCFRYKNLLFAFQTNFRKNHCFTNRTAKKVKKCGNHCNSTLKHCFGQKIHLKLLAVFINYHYRQVLLCRRLQKGDSSIDSETESPMTGINVIAVIFPPLKLPMSKSIFTVLPF